MFCRAFRNASMEITKNVIKNSLNRLKLSNLNFPNMEDDHFQNQLSIRSFFKI